MSTVCSISVSHAGIQGEPQRETFRLPKTAAPAETLNTKKRKTQGKQTGSNEETAPAGFSEQFGELDALFHALRITQLKLQCIDRNGLRQDESQLAAEREMPRRAPNPPLQVEMFSGALELRSMAF